MLAVAHLHVEEHVEYRAFVGRSIDTYSMFAPSSAIEVASLASSPRWSATNGRIPPENTSTRGPFDIDDLVGVTQLLRNVGSRYGHQSWPRRNWPTIASPGIGRRRFAY
jgi:hypothetical protein